MPAFGAESLHPQTQYCRPNAILQATWTFIGNCMFRLHDVLRDLVQEADACRPKEDCVDGGRKRKGDDSSGHFQQWPKSDLCFVSMQDDPTVTIMVCAASLHTLSLRSRHHFFPSESPTFE